jgi:hypothetical protein
MLEDSSGNSGPNNRSNQQVKRINSVHLLKRLIEDSVDQKKKMGIFPRRRHIDQKFREKVRHNSDINVINSTIISKNYQ